MNDKLLSAITFILFVSGAGAMGYVGIKSYLIKRQQTEVGELGCVAHRETAKMQTDSMSGLIEKDQMFDVLHGYYKCNPIKKNELVYFSPSPTIKPTVRKLWGLPGDSFALVESPTETGRFQVLINQQPVSTVDGVLVIEAAQTQALRSFETARKGLLGPDEFIIFSNKMPPFNDSVRFGLVKSSHFKGRVVEAEM